MCHIHSYIKEISNNNRENVAMSDAVIYALSPITFRLDLKDPFLFTAHHIDHFPKANANLGPATAAQHQEFNMYYGDTVPRLSRAPAYRI